MPRLALRLVAGLLIVFAQLPTAAVAAECWHPPVTAPVTDPYRPPACRWCPGNRGLEFGSRAGSGVRAAATGRVTFSGRVAGTVYVVVRHADGLRATYGGLATRVVGHGDLVVAGNPIGTAAGPLHFGLRDGARYLDPTPRIGRLVRRPWLLPTSGDRPARAPRPILRCGV